MMVFNWPLNYHSLMKTHASSKVDIPVVGTKCNDRVKEVRSVTRHLTSARSCAGFFALKIPKSFRFLFKFLWVPTWHKQVKQQLLNSALVARRHESRQMTLYSSRSPKSLKSSNNTSVDRGSRQVPMHS